VKLSCGDHTFPLLELPAVLDLISAMGFEGFDLAMMGNRSHVRPENVRDDVLAAATAVKAEVERRGLAVSDMFLIPWTDFERYAPNHPDPAAHAESRELFLDMADFAEALGTPGITTLPGIEFAELGPESSLQRAAEELQWRAEHLAGRGIGFSVECHIGSVAQTPDDAMRLLELAPDLRLTLDYTHFIAPGFPQAEIDVLLPRARHVQVRGARPGRPQCRMDENTVDYDDVMHRLSQADYPGYVCLEYVWDDWEHMNECDNVSETILLRDRLRAASIG
jgi:sugar phosphate isomerase/epimerase